jgi:hypothetical protein
MAYRRVYDWTGRKLYARWWPRDVAYLEMLDS